MQINSEIYASEPYDVQSRPRNKIIAATLALVLISLGTIFGINTAASAYGDAAAEYTASTDTLNELHIDALEASATLSDDIRQAETLAGKSVGHVLDDTILGDNTRRISEARTAQQNLDAATEALGLELGLLTDRALPWQIGNLIEAANNLSSNLKPLIVEANRQTSHLTDATPTITAAIADWETENTRLAALRIETARIAAEAAETERIAATRALVGTAVSQGTATALPNKVITPSVSGPAHYKVYVGKTADATDMVATQALVDAGGQVAVSYAAIGMTFIGAHNYNDSTALELKTGDLVTFSGVVTGTWRATTSVDIQSGGSIKPALSLGTTMLMQTCYWGISTTRAVGLVPA